MKQPGLPRLTLHVLLALLCFGILTLWVPEFWALGILQAGIFLMGLVWSLALLFGHQPLRFAPALIPLGAAACWPLVQLATQHTIYRWSTWDSLWNWIADLVVFFLALETTSNPELLRRFLQALIYFGGGLAALSIVQTFTSAGKIFWLFPSGYSDYVLGPFVYQNHFAAFVELILPAALYFALIGGTGRVVPASIAAVMVSSVIASASRIGTMLVLAELFVVPFLAIRADMVSRRVGSAFIAKIGALSSVGAFIVGYSVVWRRFLHEDPFIMRREVWTAAVDMIKARPVIGSGLGTWITAYPQYAVFDPGLLINQAHSDWLQFAAEGGVPFLLFIAAFAALLTRPALRSIWGVGVISFLAHAAVDYPFQQRPALAALFFAVAGAAASAPIKRPVSGHTGSP